MGTWRERCVVAGAMGTLGALTTGGLGQTCQQAWMPLGAGVGYSASGNMGYPFAMAAFPLDGGGGSPAIWIAGDFTTPGPGLAVWDGAELTAAPAYPFDRARDVAVFDGDGGARLYVITSSAAIWSAPNAVVRWDGTEWQTVGIAGTFPLLPPPPRPSGSFRNMIVHDDGLNPALYVAGQFSAVSVPPCAPHVGCAAVVQAQGVARWTGQEWQPVGQGLSGLYVGPSSSGRVALASFDDGQGPGLYVGFDGTSSSAGEQIRRLAKWDGEIWSEVGGGVHSGAIDSLAVYDDGSGPALYLAGSFSSVGIPVVHARGVARWDGTSWQALGLGVMPPTTPMSLAVHDDGSGPALYIGGRFVQVDVNHVWSIARWDGSGWSTLGGGIAGADANMMWPGRADVWTMRSLDDGTGPALFIGGRFNAAGGAQVGGLVRWSGCPCLADCDGSGLLNVDDLICFIDEFAAAITMPQALQVTHWANCNHSGGLDIDDFTCFLNRLAAGCR